MTLDAYIQETQSHITCLPVGFCSFYQNSGYGKEFHRAVVSQIKLATPKLAAPFENPHYAGLNIHQYRI